MTSEELETTEKRTRRAAANKATRLAAEQLEDTSDDDDDDERPCPSFGESSKRKQQVKATYGKKKQPAKENNVSSSTAHISVPLLKPSRPSTSSRKRTVKRKQSPPSVTAKQPNAEPPTFCFDSDSDIVILDGPPSPQPWKQPHHARSSSVLRNSEQPGLPSKKRKYHESYPEDRRLATPPPHEADPAKASGSRGDSRDARRKLATGAPPPREPSPMLVMSVSSTNQRVLSVPRSVDPKYDNLDLKEDVVLVFTRLDHSGAPSKSDEDIWWPAEVCDRVRRIW
jgi:hypothetical protein